jgi:putative membrane protein
VPFSNYLGWFLTVFVFFQLFALYLRWQVGASTAAQPLSRGYWLLAVAFYGVIAAGIPLNILTQTANAVVTDPAGVLWRTRDIYVVCGLVCLFTMVPFTIFSVIRLADWPALVLNPARASEPEGLGEPQRLVRKLG